jgi:uncharacterized protein
VHLSPLSPPEQRVLGCLIEKHWTTPEQYPLSLNALRLACNQSTNRDPVTDYDEHTVREAAQRLTRYGLTRLASYHGSRSIKYRHLADEVLGLDRSQLAVLAVLLLRGPQTPGELKARSERMAPLVSLGEVEHVLDVLGERGYAVRIPRRPGQKEDRYMHLLGGDRGEELIGERREELLTAVAPAVPATEPDEPPPVASAAGHAVTGLVDRVSALEDETAALRAQLDALRQELGIDVAMSAAPDRPGT